MSNKAIPNIAILYEDAHCVVINKPADLMVHSNGKEDGPFLTDWIVEHFPMAKGVGEPARSEAGVDLDRSGIVHRLDRDTSGALIVAKTQECHAWLKKQFQDRTVFKKYLAFVWGEMEEEFGTISREIGRSGSDFRKWTAQRGARGEVRDAETYWTRIWTGISEGNPEERKDGIGNKFSLLEAEPKTGRTHQIRVHFNAIYHPVVGDSLYAPKRPPALGFERLALHSWIFEFENMEGKRIRIKAPFPEDFEKAIKELGIVLK
jgi:23S rRNA pseudouridine1911/1915/1917 synthase